MNATNTQLPAEDQHPERTLDTGSQQVLITYAVLVGLTQLIPIPVLDSQSKSYFRKRLVRSLAAAEGRALSDVELDALAAEPMNLTGFVVSALVYPLKVAFRTLFYFLTLKRATLLASRTYHFGYLVAYAMRSQAGVGSLLDRHGARDVNEAIEELCREFPINPLESAVDSSFRQSKRALRTGAALLAGSLRPLTELALPEQVSEAIAQIEAEEEREIEPVVICLQRAIASIPEGYFMALCAQLDTRLGVPSDVTSSEKDPTIAG